MTRDTRVAQDILDSQEFLAPQAFQDFQDIQAIPIRDIHPIKETIIIPGITIIPNITTILGITIMEMEIISSQANKKDSTINLGNQGNRAATTIHGELQQSNRLKTN